MTAVGVFALSIVILAVMVEAGEKEFKIEQKPLFLYGDLFRRRDRDLGESCEHSSDCSSGCCMKGKSGKSQCNRKAKIGEPCSGGQIKLDLYMERCPCEKGMSICSDEIHKCLA